MKVKSAMSWKKTALTPWSTVREAAAIMRRDGVAALPVLADGRPVGIVTDRDLVIRLLPEKHDAGSRPVGDVMTRNPASCFADHDVTDAAAIMGDEQVRHLLVLDRSGALFGVFSVDDIAENASEELAGQTLGEIVEKRVQRPLRGGLRRPE
ncbi:MAG: CBS domain protein [Rhodobacteraceae bacterium HLUCCO18]|nr:MAG: CBS domain protein [Rhodobacteraceae bacterium HLUCCO18]